MAPSGTEPSAVHGPTIYSVAERAGVSIASVSRVVQGSRTVSEPIRLRVEQAIQELNYVPLGAARSLAVGQHEALGLVTPHLVGPYYSELLIGFESRASELGLAVSVTPTEGRGDLVTTLRSFASRVDGIALLESAANASVIIDWLRGTKPVVVIAGDPGAGFDVVRAENLTSAEVLTTHLLGHRRRALLFLGDPDAAPDVRDRYQGFRAAHRRAGLRAADPVAVPMVEEAGTAFAEQLLTGRHEADALICANDELALAVMHRLQLGGLRVPEDVAVAGWDDVMAARYVRPGLTTVRQPVHDLGALAAQLLHARSAGASAGGSSRILPTEVVLRGSCGCPEPGRTAPRSLTPPD